MPGGEVGDGVVAAVALEVLEGVRTAKGDAFIFHPNPKPVLSLIPGVRVLSFQRLRN